MLSKERFTAAAQKYMDMIFRLAFSYLKSREDADDVTQNVLLALYKTDKDFESAEHMKAWRALLLRGLFHPGDCPASWRPARHGGHPPCPGQTTAEIHLDGG